MNFYKELLLVILFLNTFSCTHEKIMNDEYAERGWLDVERFWENQTGPYQEYFFTEGDSVFVKQSNILFHDCNYFEYRYFQKEDIGYYDFFSYHWNGSISHKRRVRSDFLLAVGKEYFFDLKGKITKVIDHEKGFIFPLADVEKFAIEKGGSHYKIERGKGEDGFVYWIVTLPDTLDEWKSYIYLLDGSWGSSKEHRYMLSYWNSPDLISQLPRWQVLTDNWVALRFPEDDIAFLGGEYEYEDYIKEEPLWERFFDPRLIYTPAGYFVVEHDWHMALWDCNNREDNLSPEQYEGISPYILRDQDYLYYMGKILPAKDYLPHM